MEIADMAMDLVGKSSSLTDFKEKATAHPLPQDQVQEIEYEAIGMHMRYSAHCQAELHLLHLSLLNYKAGHVLIVIRRKPRPRHSIRPVTKNRHY
jgi:hypothetical protein